MEGVTVVPKSPKAAEKFLTDSARSGCFLAQYELGLKRKNIYPDNEDAKRLLESLNVAVYENGDVDGKYMLGYLKTLDEKLGNDPKEWDEGLKLLEEAAKAGNKNALINLPCAQYNVAVNYTYDECCTGNEFFVTRHFKYKYAKTHAKARELFEKSAKSGYSEATYVMSQCYKYGYLGVPIDHVRSANYLQNAADSGHAGARKELGIDPNNSGCAIM